MFERKLVFDLSLGVLVAILVIAAVSAIVATDGGEPTNLTAGRARQPSEQASAPARSGDMNAGYSANHPYMNPSSRQPLTGHVHNIDKDTYYDTIQAAIYDADAGNTIEVSSGVYPESIVIDRAVTILGAAKSTTVIESNASDLRIQADDAHLEGFTIYGTVRVRADATLAGNIIHPVSGHYGVRCTDASPRIADNIISPYHGIRIRNALPLIINNTISSTDIHEDPIYGLACYDSSAQLIGNHIESRNIAIYCNASRLTLLNDTIAIRSLISIKASSNVTLTNTSFNKTRVEIDATSALHVFRHLTVTVLDQNGIGTAGANVSVVDRFQTEMFNGTTDAAGTVRDVVTHDYTQEEFTIVYYTPHNVTTYNGYSQDLTNVNISQSMALVITLWRETPPVRNVEKARYYDTLQDAIDDADHGNTIVADNNTYYEDLTIDRSLTLMGEDASNTTIVGQGAANALTINAENVTITGFGITNGSDYGIRALASNATISDCIIYDNDLGLYLYYAPGARVLSCTLRDNHDGGIFIHASPSSSLSDNILYNNTHNFGVSGNDINEFYLDIDETNFVGNKSIYYIIDDRDSEFADESEIGFLALISCTNITLRNLSLSSNLHGILLVNTTYSTLMNCSVQDNFAGMTFFSSTNNSISDCRYQDNYRGLSLDHAYDNVVKNCLFYNNSYGTYFRESYYNELYQNNFINNTGYQADDPCINNWFVYIDGWYVGNYWSDYSGVDNDGNALGDTRYNVPGGANKDEYPLMCRFEDYGRVHNKDTGLRYASIQAAIEDAAENHTIHVYNGIYYEHIVVNRTITLIGEDNDRVIINSSTDDDVLKIVADNVDVSTFTLVHANGWNGGAGIYIAGDFNTVSNCDLLNNKYGIYVRNSNYTVLSGCALDGNWLGILIDNSPNTTLRYNVFAQNRYPFDIQASTTIDFYQDIDETNTIDGEVMRYLVRGSGTIVDQPDIGYLGLVSCDNIIVQDLSISGNMKGIMLVDSTNVSISGTQLSRNEVGIYCYRSRDNTIHRNNFSDNTIGLQLNEQSNDNKIYHNNFINNFMSVNDSYGNSWDNGAEGNYWSDYAGTDANDDAIGDVQFSLSEADVDRYPLMYPMRWWDVIAPEMALISPRDNSLIRQGTILRLAIVDANLRIATYTARSDVAMIEGVFESIYEINTSAWPDALYNVTIFAADFGLQKTTRTFVFIVDGTRPTAPGKPLHLDDAPTGYDNDTVLEFRWASSIDAHFDGYDVYVSINASGYEYNHTVASNSTFITCLDGTSYSIKVIAVDNVSWENIYIVSDTVVCDLTAPIVSFVEYDMLINITSIVLHWETEAPDVQYYELQLDGELEYSSENASSYMLIDLSEGHHDVSIRAIDNANNVGVYDNVTIDIDITAPIITIVGEKERVIDVTLYTVHWTSADDIAAIDVKLNTRPWQFVGYASTTSFTFRLPEGKNVIALRGVDRAGNVGVPANVTIIVDTIAPRVIIIDGNQTISQKSFTMHWRSDDTDIIYYEISTDGRNWTDVHLASNHTFAGLVLGSNTLYVRAVDHANHTSGSASVEITVVPKKERDIEPEWIRFAYFAAIVFVFVIAGIMIVIREAKRGR